MYLAFLTALGGVALFVFGLKLISEISGILSVGKPREVIQRVVKPTIGAYAIGITVAGISQSSAIVGILAVEFVEKGVISLFSAFAIIMGANVGTTATAQLVSLPGFGGGIIGAISSIIGILLGFSKKIKIKTLGNSLLGIGVLFAGLSILSSSITIVSENEIVKRTFLIDNPFVLYLNGLVITSLVQSSSAITGVMVMLAKAGLISFKSSVYLTLGSNVGSCFIVVMLSLNKNLNARRTATFNLLFNFFGSLIFFPFFYAFSDRITQLFVSGNTVCRAIANFHTVFNLLCSVICLPFLAFAQKRATEKTKTVKISATKFL